MMEKSVATGELFQIELPANPSTGYVWFIRTLPPILAIRGMEYSHSKNCETRSGCGGKMIMSLKALFPGEGDLILQRARPWEKLPDETEGYHIYVKDIKTNE